MELLRLLNTRYKMTGRSEFGTIQFDRRRPRRRPLPRSQVMCLTPHQAYAFSILRLRHRSDHQGARDAAFGTAVRPAYQRCRQDSRCPGHNESSGVAARWDSAGATFLPRTRDRRLRGRRDQRSRRLRPDYPIGDCESLRRADAPRACHVGWARRYVDRSARHRRAVLYVHLEHVPHARSLWRSILAAPSSGSDIRRPQIRKGIAISSCLWAVAMSWRCSKIAIRTCGTIFNC